MIRMIITKLAARMNVGLMIVVVILDVGEDPFTVCDERRA